MNQPTISPKFDLEADMVLWEGDCLDLLREMPTDSTQLTFTSPPYNLGKRYERKLTTSEYLAWQEKIIAAVVRVTRDGGSICWQTGNLVDRGSIYPLDVMLMPIFASMGLRLRNRIIWHFGHGLHCTKRFSGRYETILWFTKGDDYTFHLDPLRVPQKYPGKRAFHGPNAGKLTCHPLGKNPGDVWEIPNVKSNHVEKTAHPCQFPVELVERFVLATTSPGDRVLDPMGGVGSTAIAALIHGRRAVHAEIVEAYNAILRKRIEQAERGDLRVRPRERPVYDPRKKSKVVPPKIVTLR